MLGLHRSFDSDPAGPVVSPRASVALLCFLITVIAPLVPVGAARATTGTDALDELPIFKVSPEEAKPFVGDFRLASSKPRHDGLISVSVGTKYDFLDGHYGSKGVAVLQGSMSVYEYEKAGRPTSWVGTLYEYRDVSGLMRIDVFSGVHNTLIGRLLLRPRGKTHLAGDLELLSRKKHAGAGSRYRVRRTYPIALAPLTEP
jgi:hypothetical protein